MKRRVGSVVLATDQGLGVLAKSFFDHGVVTEVFVREHTTRENHLDWYPNRRGSVDELLGCIDTLLLFETAFDWKVIVKAREMGVKTVLMPMYECTPDPLPYEPDVIICPSKLDLDYYQDKNSYFLPVPVDAKWRSRTKAEVFVHNAGNGGLGGRNGTKELVEAMKYVDSPIRMILRTQGNVDCDDPRVEVVRGTVPYGDLFSEGDVFVFPEKFNGLSLPLQEAYASGMLVMCGDRYPMNTWLPREPMIPVDRYSLERITRRGFKSAVIDPREIADKIDGWYGRDISEFSEMGREWAKRNSWEKLKPEYLELL